MDLFVVWYDGVVLLSEGGLMISSTDRAGTGTHEIHSFFFFVIFLFLQLGCPY